MYSPCLVSVLILVHFAVLRRFLPSAGGFEIQVKYVSSKSLNQAHLRFSTENCIGLTSDEKVHYLEHKPSITITFLRRCTRLLLGLCFPIGKLPSQV